MTQYQEVVNAIQEILKTGGDISTQGSDVHIGSADNKTQLSVPFNSLEDLALIIDRMLEEAEWNLCYRVDSAMKYRVNHDGMYEVSAFNSEVAGLYTKEEFLKLFVPRVTHSQLNAETQQEYEN